MRIGATQRYVDPLAAGIKTFRELSKTYETISRMKTKTWHRILTHYQPLHFPKFARCAGNSRSDWLLALIERFPTPASITALDREAFSAAAWPLIGRKGSKARLINDIYEGGVRLDGTTGAGGLSSRHQVRRAAASSTSATRSSGYRITLWLTPKRQHARRSLRL